MTADKKFVSDLSTRLIFFPFSFFLILVCLATGVLFVRNTVLGAAQTPEATSDAEITEQLKGRIEKAVKEKGAEPLFKRAWVGTLETIANNTLTIDTREGPKLASISAETAFVRLDGRTQIKLEDLVLGSFTIAMGYLNGNHVLDARRIVMAERPAELPKRQVVYSADPIYDETAKQLTLTLEEGEAQSLSVGAKTLMTMKSDGAITEATLDELALSSRIIAILKTQETKGKTETVLVRIHILALREPNNSVEDTNTSQNPVL